MNDTERLTWLLSRLDGLALDLLAQGPCDGHIMSPVDREDLDAAIARSASDAPVPQGGPS